MLERVWHAWRYDWPKSPSWPFIGAAVWQRGFHMPSCERVLLLPNFLPDTGPAESLFRSHNELESSLDLLLCASRRSRNMTRQGAMWRTFADVGCCRLTRPGNAWRI